MPVSSVALSPAVMIDIAPQSRMRDLAAMTGAVLLTAACAQAVIPLPWTPVPITGQTFAVLVTAAALGPLRGAGAQAPYVLLGLALPLYADRSSGIDVLFGSTGGYLVGFVVAAWLVGKGARRGYDRSLLGMALLFLAGSGTIYLLGVPWLSLVADVSLGDAVHLGLVPFVIGDLLKAVLAAATLPALWRLVRDR